MSERLIRYPHPIMPKFVQMIPVSEYRELLRKNTQLSTLKVKDGNLVVWMRQLGLAR